MKGLTPLAAFVAILTTTAATEHAASAPTALAETLRWFPADLDALLVASDFPLADAALNLESNPPDAWRAQDPVPRIFRAQATGRVHRKTDGGSDNPSPAERERRENAYVERIDQIWSVLADRQVRVAVLGAREIFPASAFGACGYAGCHVVRFTEKLGTDAAPLAEHLRAGADQVIKLGDREIAAFNWTYPKEAYLKTHSWEGLFILVPQADDEELLLATQRQLLESVLSRRANPALHREALPPSLTAWRFADTSATAWGILAKPSGDEPTAAARDIVTFEYHTGDNARFVLRAPSQSIPDEPETKVDPYANVPPPTAALFVHGLARMEVDYKLDRPAGEPARVTVPFTGDRKTVAQRGMAMTFLTGALFQHCIPK